VAPNISKLWQTDQGKAPTFAASGYVAFFDGLISFDVTGDTSFAIRNTDFFPVYPSGVSQAVVASLATGVDHAAGVKWPYAVGTNHGREFRYSVRLPKVVRDVVNFCPNSGVNAYYRLPFPANTTRTQGQANLPGPCCTHGNGYAYDMLANCADVLLAARGGVVVAPVTESNSIQYDPAFSASCTASCPNHGCSSTFKSFNVLWIKHQDGSFGQYVHFPVNGIVPQAGDVVKRGEVIGKVGVTGRSTGPHLHFAEKVNPDGVSCVMSSVVGGGCTRLMLFERQLGGGSVGECYEPKSGDSMTSNNIQQP
jgi:Peptidase family M23